MGARDVQLHVFGSVDATSADLDAAADRIARVVLPRATAFAAAELLHAHNESWREVDDDAPSPVLGGTEFVARLTLDAVGVVRDGVVELWFDDGDLFWGHAVMVQLDPNLDPRHASIEG